MSRTRHLELPAPLREAVKAAVRAEQREAGFIGDDPDDVLPGDDGEDSLFADHDAVRGHGRGTYVFDEDEAESRRLDLTDAPDPDRGPIPLPPGGDGPAEELNFEDEGG